MADGHVPADPDQRGALTVRERAVQRIAVAACLGVAGVHRHGGGLGRLAGRDLPRAEVAVAGDHVRAVVEVAVDWGVSLAAVAQRVGHEVTAALADHAGLTVDGVAVHVAEILAPTSGGTAHQEPS